MNISNVFGTLDCHFQKGASKTVWQKKVCGVYGEGDVTDGMCQKWIAKCHAGDFSRAAAPRVGRPGAVESHAGQTLTEDRSHYSTGETGHTQSV